MPTVKTIIDDEMYARLVAKRKAANLPSVSALFLEKCGELSDDIEAREIVKIALAAAKKKQKGTRFRLRDLFPKDRWEGFTKGARLRAGRLFHEKVATAMLGIRIDIKSGANHQFYVIA
jgi:hypothetical protein